MKNRRSDSGVISRRSLSGAIAGAAGMQLLGHVDGAQAQGNEASEQAADHLEIVRLTHRFARALDDRDAEAFRGCFAPGSVSATDVEKTMQFNRKFAYTYHRALNHAYMIRKDTATGMHYSIVSYVRDAEGKLTKFDTYARYPRDELVKHDGRWLFRKRHWLPIFSTEEMPVMREVPPNFLDDFK